MKDDIEIIRRALQSAKNNAFLHKRGRLHSLWDQLVEGLEALTRLETHLLPHQPSLMPNLTTADTTKSYTHKRPKPDTMPPSSRPKCDPASAGRLPQPQTGR